MASALRKALKTSLTADSQVAAESINQILGPGQPVEIRSIKPLLSFTCQSDDVAFMARCIAEAEVKRPMGIYYTPNPLKGPQLSGTKNTAKDTDIERRHWLLIDVDSTRPKDVNADETEKQAADKVAKAIYERLTQFGFEGLIYADSGNGYHIMIPVDLPNDERVHEEHRAMLRQLAKQFDADAAHVDTTTHNAGRIWKIPGTVARKGQNTPARPHRKATILTMPDDSRHHAENNNSKLTELLESGNPVDGGVKVQRGAAEK